MLTRYKELDCWFRAKIQRLARAHWSHRALDPSEALCVNTLTHTLTQQCNYSQLRDTRQQPELHPICMACYFNSIITNLYGSYCFLQIQVTGDGQVRAVRASRVLKGMDLLNMNRHLYSGHMRSFIPADLFVHTSLHKGNSDHWRMVLWKWMRLCLDCARSLCLAESRYLRKLLSFCPKVLSQGTCHYAKVTASRSTFNFLSESRRNERITSSLNYSLECSVGNTPKMLMHTVHATCNSFDSFQIQVHLGDYT